MTNITFTKNTDITTMLAKACIDIDIDDIAYCVDFRDIKRYLSIDRLNLSVYRRLTKRRHIFFSSNNLLNHYLCWGNRWMKKDDNVKYMIDERTHLWRYSENITPVPSPQDDMVRFGYRDKISTCIPCLISDHYIARFSLFTRDERIKSKIISMDPKIKIRLEHLHTKAIMKHGNTINPYLDYNLIRPTSIRVLRLLSQGCSRQQAASQCNISARGVDYHIDVLKDTLSAKNMAQLICIATNRCLL